MSVVQRTRLFVLPLLIAELAVLGWLGFIAISQAIASDNGQAWLMAWVLAFLVGMPLLVLVLAVAGALQRHDLARSLVPYSGENIPGAGQ